MMFFIHYNDNNLFIKFDSIINIFKIIIQNKTSVVLETEIEINSDFCIIPFKSTKGAYKIKIAVGKDLLSRSVFVG